jgi:predicted Zn-dependent protease
MVRHHKIKFCYCGLPRHRAMVTAMRIIHAIGAGACLMAMLAGGSTVTAHAQTQQDQNRFESLMKQGFELHQQARFAQAIPLLQQAHRLAPFDYFANLLLGIDLLRTGQPARAIPLLESAARGQPGEEFPQDYLGEAHATLGHYAVAAEAYQSALLRGKASQQALTAWAGFALERFRTIGEQLRATQEGAAQASMPVCRGSIPALERKLALKQKQSDDAAAYELSICYAFEAGKAAQQLQTQDADMPSLHRLRGDVLLRLKGDTAAALAEYQQAVKLRPDDPLLTERIAEAQAQAGDTEAARASAQAALVINPHQREALRILVELTMNARDYDQAIPWLQQLAAETPGDATVQVDLGKALANTGKPEEALHWLAPPLEAGYPDEKGALHALLAGILRKLGRTADAAQAGAQARRLSDAYQSRSVPRTPDAHQ